MAFCSSHHECVKSCYYQYLSSVVESWLVEHTLKHSLTKQLCKKTLTTTEKRDERQCSLFQRPCRKPAGLVGHARASLCSLSGVSSRGGTHIVSSGALAVSSGIKTGRSPTDKRIVDEPSTTEDIWWGKVWLVQERNEPYPMRLKPCSTVFMLSTPHSMHDTHTKRNAD
eukprot:705761-Amphidinium_carterae.2